MGRTTAKVKEKLSKLRVPSFFWFSKGKYAQRIRDLPETELIMKRQKKTRVIAAASVTLVSSAVFLPFTYGMSAAGMVYAGRQIYVRSWKLKLLKREFKRRGLQFPKVRKRDIGIGLLIGGLGVGVGLGIGLGTQAIMGGVNMGIGHAHAATSGVDSDDYARGAGIVLVGAILGERVAAQVSMIAIGHQLATKVDENSERLSQWLSRSTTRRSGSTSSGSTRKTSMRSIWSSKRRFLRRTRSQQSSDSESVISADSEATKVEEISSDSEKVQEKLIQEKPTSVKFVQ